MAAYYLGGRAGLALPQFGDHVTLIWPPAGIALAGLLRFGPGVWPGVWAGALLVALSSGLPAQVALPIAIGNTLAPLLGIWLLRRQGLHVELDRRRDLWLYALIGMGLAALLCAANALFWLALSGRIGWAGVPRAAAFRWLGDAMGALVVGVPLLTLSRDALARALAGWRWVGSALLAVGTGAAAALVWHFFGGGSASMSPLHFLPHLLLCWLAVRSGPFAASTVGLLIACGALFLTWHGSGPFANVPGGTLLLAGYLLGLLALPLLTAVLAAELAANERRWQLALDTSQIGIADWNLTSGRIEFSPRWLGLLGQSSQTFGDSLQAFWSLLHPDDLADARRALEPVYGDDAGSARVECRMRGRDGAWRLLELNALVAERTRSGRASRVLITARDISDVQALRDRQALAHSVFQHVHEGVLITDPQHRVLAANPAYAEITGYSRPELMGTIPALLQPSPSDPELAARQAEMLASLARDGIWRGEIHQRRRNGELALLQLNISAVRCRPVAARARC